MTDTWKNKLYYGDNLDILRQYVDDESVDLIYLDPPFNSNATYNVLFQEKNGSGSAAQITAFDDFWHWDQAAELTYHELVKEGPPAVSKVMQALRDFLGSNDLMAYLTMMAIRLVELRRVLKPTGSIYLHCDPTASHYLKIVMDAVFGHRNIASEIIWAYGTPSGGRAAGQRPVKGHDTILFYASNYGKHTYNKVFLPYDEKYIRERFIYEDEDGRQYRTRKRTRADGTQYETRQYLDESPGVPLSNVWSDIKQLYAYHWVKRKQEELGYPTQKPEALLERVIQASSNEGDVVLDPFCGCGTTIAVAERLHRRWIGIDVTHLAITLMKHRLRDTFADLNEYEVIGDPQDLTSARALAEQDRHQFELWALGLVEAQPAQEQRGSDRGMDGLIHFRDDDSGKYKRIIVQVKSGGVGAAYVRDLRGVLEREEAQIAALVTLEPPTQAMTTEAVSAGYYEPPALLEKVPRLQILTVEGLLAGSERLEYPEQVGATFRRAARQTKPKRRGQPAARPVPEPEADGAEEPDA